MQSRSKTKTINIFEKFILPTWEKSQEISKKKKNRIMEV